MNQPHRYMSVPSLLNLLPTSYPSLFHVGEKYDLLIDGDYAVSIKSTKNNGVATIVSNYDSLVVGDPLWVKFE